MVKSLSRNKFWHRFTAFSQISPYMPWYSSIYPVVSKCIPLSPDHGWYVNIINPWLTSNICIYIHHFFQSTSPVSSYPHDIHSRWCCPEKDVGNHVGSAPGSAWRLRERLWALGRVGDEGTAWGADDGYRYRRGISPRLVTEVSLGESRWVIELTLW